MNLHLDLNFKRHFAGDAFFFGVANAPYLCEGGYNTPDGPKNNFGYFERDGLVPPSGAATNFWDEYEAHIGLAASLGLTAFRTGIEWARVQPTTRLSRHDAPAWDFDAVEKYVRILEAVYRSKMEPVVTLHHFTYPAWLGRRFWLEREAADIAAAYEVRLVNEINIRLVRDGYRPLAHFITFNELNLTPPKTLTGTLRHVSNAEAPLRDYTSVFDNVLSAHLQVYDGIKSLYEAEGWAEPLVGFGTATQAPYELDRLMLDVVRLRQDGIPREAALAHLAQCRARWNARLSALAMRQLTDEQFAAYDAEVNAVHDAIDPSGFTKTLDALYSADREKKLDYISANVYEPFRTGRAAGNADRAPRWWEFAVDGDIYRTMILAYNDGNEDLPMFMGENSLAYEQPVDGPALSRPDGWTREAYFKTYLMEIVKCIAEGVPIRGYLYWSLVDDFEWDAGFVPRLGLYNYDYSTRTIQETDGLGEAAGAVFASLAAALRSADKARIQAAFTKRFTSDRSGTERNVVANQ